MGGLFSSPSKEENDTDDETTPTPNTQPTPYTYMFPGSFVKFKNDIDGIYKIDIRKNDGKVINPNIFKTSDGNFSPELLKAVDYKIQQQYDYNHRRRDNDGTSVWDNWVPGQASPVGAAAGGGKRRRKTRKSRKTKKARKSRKN
jgi:hypothetical protein